jgi:transcriptional regulator with XRE-family HTH domain
MTPDARLHFAELLTAARKKVDSRTAFARDLGITRTTLRAWESGQQEPKDHHLVRVAEVLGISLQELRGDIVPEDPRLRELTDEDWTIARQFHYASVALKFTAKELLTAPISTAVAERIAQVVRLLVRHQGVLLANCEDIAFSYDTPHRAIPQKRSDLTIQPVSVPKKKP